jgi:hypothetical protein
MIAIILLTLQAITINRLFGPALRKTLCDRKVDKCGTVFGEATLYVYKTFF